MDVGIISNVKSVAVNNFQKFSSTTVTNVKSHFKICALLRRGDVLLLYAARFTIFNQNNKTSEQIC